MVKYIFPLAALLFMTSFSGSDACSCLYPVNWQNVLCGQQPGHVVLRVKVIFPIITPSSFADNYYLVQIQHIYKDMSGNIVYFFGLSVISTAGQSAACGITLTVGQTYILNGYVGVDGFIRVGICNYIRSWDVPTDLLVQNWLNNCNCVVNICQSVKGCAFKHGQCNILTSDSESSRCLQNNYCEQNSCNKRCSWNERAGCKLPKWYPIKLNAAEPVKQVPVLEELKAN